MALFDALIDDMANRFRLGSNAAPLVREGLSLIAVGQGGVGSFLDLFRKAGFAPQVSAWLGQPNPPALATQDLERVVGTSALGGIASRLGLSQPAVTTALAYCVPKLIGLLTPGGVVPTALPAEVTNFLARAGGQVTPSQISSARRASSEQTTPDFKGFGKKLHPPGLALAGARRGRAATDRLAAVADAHPEACRVADCAGACAGSDRAGSRSGDCRGDQSRSGSPGPGPEDCCIDCSGSGSGAHASHGSAHAGPGA